MKVTLFYLFFIAQICAIFGLVVGVAFFILRIFKIVHCVEDAADEIERFYSNYHSLRYVKDRLVVRFKKPIRDNQLTYVNAHFKDILVTGRFTRSGALPEEFNQPDLNDLPRLVFKFNRLDNGRLRELIDYMNRT